MLKKDNSTFKRNIQMQQDQILYIFVSKYSSACSGLIKLLPLITKYVQCELIDIDNPKLREMVVDTIENVPSIIVLYPLLKDNNIELYEGSDAFSLIQKIASLIQEKLENDNNIAQQQIVQQHLTQQQLVEQLSQLNNSQQNIIHPPQQDNIIDDISLPHDLGSISSRSVVPPHIKKGEGHENMKSSLSSIKDDDSSSLNNIIDDSFLDNNMSGIITPTNDFNMNDIIGSSDGGGMINKEATLKSNKITNSVKEMMRQRDELMNQGI
jgi:hypothetical protein